MARATIPVLTTLSLGRMHRVESLDTSTRCRRYRTGFHELSGAAGPERTARSSCATRFSRHSTRAQHKKDIAPICGSGSVCFGRLEETQGAVAVPVHLDRLFQHPVADQSRRDRRKQDSAAEMSGGDQQALDVGGADNR